MVGEKAIENVGVPAYAETLKNRLSNHRVDRNNELLLILFTVYLSCQLDFF